MADPRFLAPVLKVGRVSVGHNRALQKFHHSATRLTFEEVGDDTVRVNDLQGRKGFFHWDGRHLRGELKQANQQLVPWAGGPRTPLPVRS